MISHSCVLCKQTFVSSNRGTIKFSYLKGSPEICERCFFERVTGEQRDWTHPDDGKMNFYIHRND